MPLAAAGATAGGGGGDGDAERGPGASGVEAAAAPPFESDISAIGAAATEVAPDAPAANVGEAP